MGARGTPSPELELKIGKWAGWGGEGLTETRKDLWEGLKHGWREGDWTMACQVPPRPKHQAQRVFAQRMNGFWFHSSFFSLTGASGGPVAWVLLKLPPHFSKLTLGSPVATCCSFLTLCCPLVASSHSATPGTELTWGEYQAQPGGNSRWLVGCSFFTHFLKVPVLS